MTKEGKPTSRGADSRKKRLEHFATSLDSFLSKINNVDVDISCSCWVLAVPRDIGYGSPCSATDWEPYEALLREFEINYRLSYHCSLLAAKDRKRILNLKNQVRNLTGFGATYSREISDSYQKSRIWETTQPSIVCGGQ